MRALPLITSAMLVVTHECNLRCRYCFVRKEPRRMTLETAKAAADFLLENARRAGVRPEINFFGGEPMLMFDSVIKPLVEWVHNELGENMRFSITTNGTLLNDGRIRFMQRHKFGLLLSMDGNKPVQNWNRPYADGSGSFDRLAHIVPKVLAAWPGTTFRMTAIPESCGRTYDSIMWAAAQGFKNFFVTPNVFEPWSELDRGILAMEMRKYADYYVESKKTGVKPILFSTFEQAFNDIRQIARAEARGDYRALPKCKSRGKCGLGTSRFASIHPSGDIYACQEMTSNEGDESPFYIGSIYSGVDNERRRALAESFDSVTAWGEYCAECEYDRICDGGCVANNYMVTGKLGALPEVYCWWKRLLLAEAERIYGREGEICRTKA